MKSTFHRVLDINITESMDFAYIVMEVLGRPTHIVEVGVYKPGHMQSLPFVFDDKCRIQLFEPQPNCADTLRSFFDCKKNVEINEVAIGAEYGQATLCVPQIRTKCPDAGSSAFLEGVYSPYSAREEAGSPETLEEIRVEVAPLSDFDDGTIEAITIDTEGNEWPVIQTMISRPKVIGVEMCGPMGYENQNKALIESWMQDNGYKPHTVGKTDVIYVRSDNV